MPTQKELDACKLLPLRQNVKWVDLSFLFPGIIIEEERDPKHGKFNSVDLENTELAAMLVKTHNESIKGAEIDPE